MTNDTFTELHECLTMINDLDSMIQNLQETRQAWNLKLLDLIFSMREKLVSSSMNDSDKGYR
jgi:hypothetical protein